MYRDLDTSPRYVLLDAKLAERNQHLREILADPSHPDWYPTIVECSCPVIRSQAPFLDPQEVEVIVQETAVDVWKYINKPGSSVPNNPRPWVGRIARDNTIDYLRKPHDKNPVEIDRPQNGDPNNDPIEIPDPRATFEANFTESIDFQRALASLSPDARRVVGMMVLGMSTQNIAEELGRTYKATDSFISRIKKKLKKKLE